MNQDKKGKGTINKGKNIKMESGGKGKYYVNEKYYAGEACPIFPLLHN